VLATYSLRWTELARRTWREVVDDDVLGLAAQLSYYFFLALFPAILFLLALASFFPLSNITDDVGRSLGPFVSPQVLELIQEQMRRLANGTVGVVIVVLLWFYVSGIAILTGAELNAEIEHTSPYGKARESLRETMEWLKLQTGS
jgi:membrane protein